jgi:hypothetical protein
VEIEVVAVESGRAGKKAIEATGFDAAIAVPALPGPANHRGIRSDQPVRLSCRDGTAAGLSCVAAEFGAVAAVQKTFSIARIAAGG